MPNEPYHCQVPYIEPLVACGPLANGGSLSTRERWTCLSPMIFLFLALALLARFGQSFEDIYDSTQIPLPKMTEVFLSLHTALVEFPWAFTGSMFALCWIYFNWICKKRSRARYFRLTMWALFLTISVIGTTALIVPVFSIDGPIRKK